MQNIYKKEFRCPTTVIAYGADIRHSKSPELIQKWGLLPGGYYLVVGRLVPDNNTDTIIREFIKSPSPKKLVIVGDVPYRDLYAQRLKSNSDSRLLFTGYVRDADELAELYHGCFAYLHGHEFGGTNPSLLMALGCGCAVCALDTLFNREVLKDGEHGLFFLKDENSLKNRIEEMEYHPEELDRLRMKSRARVEANYSWDKILGQYLVLFDKVIKGR
jgi:glycosyltransferase involved in cell wall biosynthesis